MGTIFIDQQQLQMMDWSPRVIDPRMQTLAAWNYSQTDMINLCVQCVIRQP